MQSTEYYNFPNYYQKDADDQLSLAFKTYDQIIDIIKTFTSIGSNLSETLRNFFNAHGYMIEDIQNNIMNITKLFSSYY